MNHLYSHLIWLGAGSAQEPTGIIDLAEKVTLIEARELACNSLRKKFSQQNIAVFQQLVGCENKKTTFTEYSLVEYSATKPVAGVLQLFPGIKKVNSEQRETKSVVDILIALNINTNDNLLIIDIPDISLGLLTVLQNAHQLNKFQEIQATSSIEPLYEGSADTAEIIAFMQASGYSLAQKNNSDRDMPWLTFSLNPLWDELQHAKKEIIKQQILTHELKKSKESLSAEIEKNKVELQRSQKLEQDQKNIITNLQGDLVQANKLATSRKDIFTKTEKENSILEQNIKELNDQINMLKTEILKTEAQIELIKDLMISSQLRTE